MYRTSGRLCREPAPRLRGRYHRRVVGFLRGTFKLLLWLAVPAAIAVGILRVFFVDVVTVGHNGMAPTLLLGDQVLVWRDAEIQHGDIVVCRHPGEAGRFVMGRVFAMPGMSLGMERDYVVVNGRAPERDFRDEVRFEDPSRENQQNTYRLVIEQLGNDFYWSFDDEDRPLRIRPIAALSGLYLLGDHRAYPGEDSRAFGVVQASACIGQVFLRLAPGPYAVEGVPHGWLDMLHASR